jgi:hypothetical protein
MTGSPQRARDGATCSPSPRTPRSTICAAAPATFPEFTRWAVLDVTGHGRPHGSGDVDGTRKHWTPLQHPAHP